MGRGGVNSSIRKWEKYSDIEKDIFKLNHYFIGRTTWDKACLMEFNEKLNFSYGGEELLRSPFTVLRGVLTSVNDTEYLYLPQHTR